LVNSNQKTGKEAYKNFLKKKDKDKKVYTKKERQSKKVYIIKTIKKIDKKEQKT